MAKMNFGGTMEEVVTREEFPLEKARETLKDEMIAVLGYGVQGPAQALNMRDNGFNVIVGQRKKAASLGRRPLMMAGLKEKLCLKSKKQPSAVLSFVTYYQMRPKYQTGKM